MKWIDELVKLIIDPKSTRHEIDALKSNFLPRSLFQYRSVSTRKLQSFQADEVWAGSPLFLNDPYDVHIFVDPERLKSELISRMFQDLVSGFELDAIQNRLKNGEESTAILVEVMKEMCLRNNIPHQFPYLWNQLQLQLQETINGSSAVYKHIRACIGVSSFSERYDSPLMWAHYAESHTGYCVEYDFSGSVALSNLFPAIYRDAVFDCSCIFDDVTWRQAILSTLVKSTDWSYEREWRMVLSKEKPIGRGIPVNVPTPIRVYLGSLIASENKEKIIDICNKKEIDVFQMHHSNNAFKMEFQKI